MDREQAIEKLNDIRCHVKETSAEEQALVMAIEALKKPEIVRCGECELKGTRNCVANTWATIFGFGVKDDFYCGLAERRTDK